MTIYHVANWGERYENNRSRKVKDLDWVPIPNKHDGEKYSRLMLRPQAAELFAAWILILQVASKCHPRGSLVRDDGTPLDAESLSIKTRAPAAWFEHALPALAKMGWLVPQVNEQLELASDCHHDATTMPPRCHPGDEEGKGREGKEGKGTSPAPPAEVGDGRHGQITSRWGALYRESFSTGYGFTGRDAAALKRFLPTITDTADEILAVASRAWVRVKQDRYAKHCKEAATIWGLCAGYNQIQVELQAPNPGENGVIGKRSSMAG